MTEEGFDLSHHNGKMTLEIAKKLIKIGKFFYVKFSQGTNFKDKEAENTTRILQSVGGLVGPYHFVTNDNALNQFKWFKKCMGNFLFDLPPAMDCEAFTVVNGVAFSETELRTQPLAQAEFTRLSVESGKFSLTVLPENQKLAVWSAYNYSYPKKEIIDVIGRNLKNWMSNYPLLAKYPQPAIYTNKGSGDRIFDMSAISWSKYLLWVANWGVTTPALPNIWKGKPYFIWQNAVIDASQFGIAGKLDHNLWGNYMPFPYVELASASASPSPEPGFIEANIEFSTGTYTGKLLEV